MFDEGVAGCRPHRIPEKRTPMTKSFCKCHQPWTLRCDWSHKQGLEQQGILLLP